MEAVRRRHRSAGPPASARRCRPATLDASSAPRLRACHPDARPRSRPAHPRPRCFAGDCLEPARRRQKEGGIRFAVPDFIRGHDGLKARGDLQTHEDGVDIGSWGGRGDGLEPAIRLQAAGPGLCARQQVDSAPSAGASTTALRAPCWPLDDGWQVEQAPIPSSSARAWRTSPWHGAHTSPGRSVVTSPTAETGTNDCS